MCCHITSWWLPPLGARRAPGWCHPPLGLIYLAVGIWGECGKRSMEREEEFFFARVYFGINDAWFWAPGHLRRLVPQRAPQLHYITGPGRGIKQETNTAECAWAGAELLPCPRGLAGPWHGAWHRITRGTESHRTKHPRDRRLSGLPLTLSLWLPARFQALLGPGGGSVLLQRGPPGEISAQRLTAGRGRPRASSAQHKY